MRRRSLFIFALLLMSAPLWARSLSWSRMDVVANLDADGRLHSSETLTYRFDGDWNGGERSFNVRIGQTLAVNGVFRIDGGQTIPLVNGDLSKVDHYELLPGNVLRWRSRMPDDPPFENREITYRIDTTLGGVLRRIGSTYRLAHDFSFPNRQGEIRNFTLKLTIDPAWGGGGSERTITIARALLPPGQSVVVSRELRYQGAGKPAATIAGISRPVSVAFVLLFLIGLSLLIARFASRERAWGRLAPLAAPRTIDDAWLSQHLFSIPPEVAGAAADDKIGPPSVAAVLARMTQEKKIGTSIEKHLIGAPVLHMKLLVPRESLPNSEGALVRKLFFNDRTESDTETVRKHYKSAGLDLAAVIRKGIEEQTAKLPKWNSKKPRANFMADALAIVAALVIMIAAAFQGGNDTPFVTMLILAGFVCCGAASIAANLNSHAVDRLLPRFALVTAFMFPLFWVTIHYFLTAGDYLVHVPTLMAIALWTLALTNIVLDALRIPDAPEKVAFRKSLASARRYLVWQLRQPEPRLRDAWYPYILALGLGKNVDAWFRGSARGAATHVSGAAGSTTVSTSSVSAESSGSPAWTGGGGAFGGAGASASWAVAAGAIASGVSAPSSSGGGSSGGGGGGGGGSSSGGGGGGGW